MNPNQQVRFIDYFPRNEDKHAWWVQDTLSQKHQDWQWQCMCDLPDVVVHARFACWRDLNPTTMPVPLYDATWTKHKPDIVCLYIKE